MMVPFLTQNYKEKRKFKVYELQGSQDFWNFQSKTSGKEWEQGSFKWVDYFNSLEQMWTLNEKRIQEAVYKFIEFNQKQWSRKIYENTLSPENSYLSLMSFFNNI
jgi:hypothetical protein